MNKRNRKEYLPQILPYLLTVLLFLVFGITRLWRLTTLPSGVHLDEAGMAYDAWCLSQYGVDRYLKSFPVYFINFGGGQNALYTYLTAGLFRLFGFHEILMRVPAVTFSLLTLIFEMLTVKKLFPNKPYLVLGSGALVTICPFFILTSRFGVESYLMLGATAAFLYFFISAIDSEKYRYYVLAGISGGIILYTYAMSYLMLPMFLLLAFVYVLYMRKFSLNRWIAMGIPMFLLAFPLIMTQFINMFDWEEMHLGIFTLTKLPEYRVSELQPFSFDSLKLIISNIFIGDMWNYNSIPGIPNMYWISIPLILIGLIHVIYRTVLSFKNRTLDFQVLTLLWFLCVIYITCHITPCLTQLNSIFFVFVLFIADAVSLIPPCKKWGGHAVKAAVAGVYAFLFFQFATYYYLGGYTVDYYPVAYFDILTPDAIEFIEEHREYGPKGVQMAEMPIFFALSSLYSPYDLQLFDPHELYLMDGYYHCNCLGEIEDGYFYIVRDIYGEYADKLRAAGFTEINYGNHYLFYRE